MYSWREGRVRVSAGRIWTGTIARTLLPFVEFHYTFGRDLDRDWNDPDEGHTVSIAQVLTGVLGAPGGDAQLVEVCRRDGLQAPEATLWSLAVLGSVDARTPARAGVVTPAGVIESAGEHLGLVETPEAGRYREWFYLPGVAYPGGGVL